MAEGKIMTRQVVGKKSREGWKKSENSHRKVGKVIGDVGSWIAKKDAKRRGFRNGKKKGERGAEGGGGTSSEPVIHQEKTGKKGKKTGMNI